MGTLGIMLSAFVALVYSHVLHADSKTLAIILPKISGTFENCSFSSKCRPGSASPYIGTLCPWHSMPCKGHACYPFHIQTLTLLVGFTECLQEVRCQIMTLC